MANDAGKQKPPSLEEFSERLDAMRGEPADPVEPKAASGKAWGNAFRISTELLVGIFVGALLGVGLDRWLGTGPLFLLIGIVLGFAAGLRNLSRTMNNNPEAPDGE